MSDLVTLPPATLAEGVHDLTDDAYFALTGHLSSTGIRELLKPGGPARFKHKQDTATINIKREFDLGHAVHTLVLGSGPVPVLFPGTGKNPEAWQKEDDKAKVAALRAEGKVPLRPKDWTAAHDMAAAVNAHPLAKKLLVNGAPEQAMIWTDPATGVLCRAKADWLGVGIVDLKTAESAAPDALSKAANNFGHAIQAPFYLRGFRACFPRAVREPYFVHISVEKEPPYLVHVHQLTERALAWGDRQVRAALEIYRDCLAAGVWPGYPTDQITDIDLPAYVRTEEF